MGEGDVKNPENLSTLFMEGPLKCYISLIFLCMFQDCLQYLNKLEVEEFEDIKSGYRIKLYFDKNPYFDNDILTKEFHLGSSGDPASQSTPIQWKESMDLAAKFAQRTAAAQENAAKSGSRKRGHQQQATFFTWFCDNGDPSDDEIAEVIKDDMW